MREAAAGPPREKCEHLPGHFEICDDTINHGCENRDVARLAPLYFVRLSANRYYFARNAIDGNKRRLIQYDPAASHINDRCRGSHVNSHRIRDQISQTMQANKR